MDTLHRIAGINADSDDRSAPAQPATAPPPAGRDGDDERRMSRASLPLSRKASRKSVHSTKSRANLERDYNEKYLPNPPNSALFSGHTTVKPGDLEAGLATRSTRSARSRSDGSVTPTAGTTTVVNDDEEADDDYDEEDLDRDSEGDTFEWGPDHPCFPHPNPHVAPDSKAASSTRVIRVRRDYMAAGDRYPQFANLYPEVLDPLVSDADFRMLIAGLNAMCRQSFDAFTWRAWTDAFLGAATGWVWEDLGLTGVKTGAKRIERFVNAWNAGKRKEGKEVALIQPRDVAFMSLDFVIPDPGLDLQGDE